MANTDIYPYGQNQELPAGYPIADDLITNSAQQALSARQGKILNEKIGKAGMAATIVVAASNTPSELKASADYVCDGTNDEVELNNAIAEALSNAKNIVILRGDYYLDAPTKTYNSSNDTFLLVDTTPPVSGPSLGIVISGEDAKQRPKLHISSSAYNALSSSKQYSLFAVYDSSLYGGYVELNNLRFHCPDNQKQICAIDMLKYGGWARLHSVSCYAYDNVVINDAPRKAPSGSIGVRFIGKGPCGGYGSEMTNMNVTGFNEGICINTEWARCIHVGTVFCVTGWVFGKYTSGTVHASTHPSVLLLCGDERSNSPALFYKNSGFQQIEMIAFSIERDSQLCPVDENNSMVLGPLAKVEGGSGNGLEFRGSISYTTYNPHSGGVANSPNIGFWEFGHGHGMKTTDASHAQAGTTTLRNTYRPNFMQRYFDTSLGTNGKEIICIDESGNNGKGTWVDAAGNIV